MQESVDHFTFAVAVGLGVADTVWAALFLPRHSPTPGDAS
jgi:hypothetical protein